ncbi:glutathione binding-like protein [Acinetobacter pittii]|jgi:glutathione S-transferase|uniref:glutathione binding-like protein n=1 Tax=Acinetobacter pittii TaxID=48296 RepID=UPI000851A626|nr:glutathione binding-like protein [Acinetobacter pittii]KAI0679892.1 glutathione binding-like protein [Acinetobacter pittii]MBA0121224.1 glutathione S-transferase family protein [Acinetobacter pittii]MBA0129176.1 glutathione S-transferase family protein [Acinetobacter pittii]MBA0132679.1 glutathione S-transferase family protein [Acinetobacter pittii]MBA0151854.1 glutathione S-transferase family protein [Acinetobacter pittii]
MRIRLFHLQNSRSQRIIWFLEELGLNYELTIKDHSGIDKDKNSPHQLSKFPTIEIIEQGKTSILAETSAILDYLSHLHPQLGPNSLLSQQLQNFYYWKNYSEATFIPDLVLKQIFHQIVKRTPFPVCFIPKFLKYGFDQGYLNQSLQRQMSMIDKHLEHHLWFAGDQFTTADILMWFPLLACSPNYRQFKHIQRYLAQIENRPAFKNALIKGRWSASTFKAYWTTAW